MNPITDQNPRGAGRKKTGEKRQFSVTGLSPELAAWIDQQPNKSALILAALRASHMAALQVAYDKE